MNMNCSPSSPPWNIKFRVPILEFRKSILSPHPHSTIVRLKFESFDFSSSFVDTMRLINTNTLLLESKRDLSELKYAILSHTWGPDDHEVTFEEWTFVHHSAAIKGSCPHVHMSESDIKAKSGYIKIIEACDQAKRDGLDYLWCDTNCINKESSAELSEAINSML